jgi:hypothetical protein
VPITQTTASAISENRMSLNPAFLALPECFMWQQGKG